MHRSAWKKTEMKAARKFGSTRNPLSGGNSKHTRSDTLHDKFFIEVKHLSVVPGYSLYEQTAEFAKAEGKLPLVIYKKKHEHGEIVVLSLDDFVTLIGGKHD